MNTLPGIGYALITAMAWAGSAIINKFLTTRIDILSLNTVRLWVGAVILTAFIVFTGRMDTLLATPLSRMLLIAVAGLISFSIGDTAYIKSLSFIDVSRGFPIAQCTFPVLTMFVAIFFLNEPFTLVNITGGFLVVGGVYLVVVLGNKVPLTSKAVKRADARGVFLALMAAVSWTTGASLLKLGITGIDPFVAAAVRILVSALGLTLFVLCRQKETVLQFKQYGFSNIALAAGAGVLSYGVAAVALISAMQLIGAGKTVLITAIAPILILPLSFFILKERPTPITVLGVFIGVIGLVFISCNR
ncbi:MAG TPA: DMT family transporter [Desulfosalsimonadaceae bacterium]|nr:DMT family transporter [Desulfosalsimonadaceae bacterium]